VGPTLISSTLLDIGLSNFSPSRSILGYLHPAPATDPAPDDDDDDDDDDHSEVNRRK
jgi:hypothetical protein